MALGHMALARDNFELHLRYHDKEHHVALICAKQGAAGRYQLGCAPNILASFSFGLLLAGRHTAGLRAF